MIIRSLILLIILAAGCRSAVGQSKIDLAAYRLINEYNKAKAGEGDDVTASVPGVRQAQCAPKVSVIVTLNAGYGAEDLMVEPGIECSTVLEDMVIVSLPVDRIELVAENEAVKSLSVGRKHNYTMAFARPTANVNQVQTGTGLPRSYTGKGVVFGLYDGGLDPNHVNFAKTGKVGTSRVKAVYVFGNSNNADLTASAESRDDIKKFTTDNVVETHGTHVAGVATGSYRAASDFGMNGLAYKSTDMPYYGIATDADIVMSAGQLTEANILAGLTKCVEYAESVDKPAVINLSLGSLLGPHDGSNALCQGMAKLGRRAIICVASGNDAQYNKAMTLDGGSDESSLVNSAVGLTYSTGVVTSPYNMTFWSGDNTVFGMEFVIYDTSKKEVVYALNVPNTRGRGLAVGGESMGSAYQKDAFFSQAFSATSYIEFYSSVESNHRYCVESSFILNVKSGNTTLKPGFRFTRTQGQTIYGLIDTPSGQTTGQFSVESGTGWNGLQWDAAKVGNNGTINDLATGENVLVVGAYTSATNFTVTGGTTYSYRGATAVNDICPFSSYGRNVVTGESLPHVTAPGSAIVSSLSEYKTSYSSNAVSGEVRVNDRNNRWGGMQGTSMSAPFVAGVTGLWLEADPTLNIDDVKDIVKKTSVPYTGSDTDKAMQWGAGRIDALAGIKEVLARKAAAIGGVAADDDRQWVLSASAGGYDLYLAGAGEIEAEMYDMQGRCVSRVREDSDEVSISTDGVMPGVYLLKASSSGLIYTAKVTVR